MKWSLAPPGAPPTAPPAPAPPNCIPARLKTKSWRAFSRAAWSIPRLWGPWGPALWGGGGPREILILWLGPCRTLMGPPNPRPCPTPPPSNPGKMDSRGPRTWPRSYCSSPSLSSSWPSPPAPPAPPALPPGPSPAASSSMKPEREGNNECQGAGRGKTYPSYRWGRWSLQLS